MIVAAVQHDISWKDAVSTHARVDPLISHAVDGGADLVVLAEMFSTGFSMAADEITQPVDGPSATFLRERADRHGVWIAGSLALINPKTGRPTNRFIAAGPTGEVVTYDKRHPFTYADEHLEFQAGDEIPTFVVDDMNVTPFICYDLRFADDFWAKGPTTDLFVVVANWPATRRHHWSSLLTARAIENQCYVVGVNRVGNADGLDYSGDSAIIDPSGVTLTTAQWCETVLSAEVSAETVRQTRERFPFLNDRR